ncbi:MAG: molybdopterin-dependent oxidoreductase [Dehalococcoidia bacterium]|nr:molybdopterin-dependent oxidoreductase [Dehalococcoidia bacterium]MDP7201059.1 molybdopterin-dependent oxidoreductase [Dehalococcoidia bacterium]MDP7510518.1 molybdopterin-dependent oxidoreductase [Dehalococcoidia bacterium]HJN87104.1 molybdopterin-dependent oxidoreductase [Dehalococcoidia bacterium]
MKLAEVAPQPGQPEEDVWVPSACGMCYSQCGIKVHRVNGVVVKIEGNPDFPHNWGRLCAKGHAAIMSLYDPSRVRTPLKRTNPEKGIGVDPKWVEIGWDEAIDLVADKLRKTRADNPDKLAMATFDIQGLRFAGCWMGAFGSTNENWISANYFCGAGLHLATYLTNASFHMSVDLSHCNYCLLIGSQHGFGVGHSPNLTTQKMADARIRGMRVVSVDPVCSNAASKADEWVPIRPGTDGALALSILNVMLNELGIYDAEFIKNKTNGPYLVGPDGLYIRDEESRRPLVWDSSAGTARPYDSADVPDMAIEGVYTVQGKTCHPAFQRLKEHVKGYSPETVSEITTVPAETIRRIAKEYGEAAKIGSTIMIGGEELPYRPAAVHMYRGAYSHKHSAAHSMAIQLLNIVVGNIYAPGGHGGPNPVGPWWEPGEGVDGLLVASPKTQVGVPPYEFLATIPEPPKAPHLGSLFPLAYARGDVALQLGTTDHEKYGVPAPDVLIHCRTNMMMTTVAPERMAQALKNIAFQVSFAREIDETVQFADVVLPDLHFLEKLDPVPNDIVARQSPGSGYWYLGIRQPVVKPPFTGFHWLDVLAELAERAGFLEDYNFMLMAALSSRTPTKLEPLRKYSLEELSDIWLKALSGDENKGLPWFQENAMLTTKRTVREVYPQTAFKYRIPLYYEHFLKARDYVEEVARQMGLDWDTSDYQVLPEWKPCLAFEPTEQHDLLVVSYTIPFHQYSISAQNPWLNEISEHHPYAYNIMVNTETARRRGIKDGANITVETMAGRKVTGKVKVTQCVHPEVVAIGGIFGAWADGKPIAKGKGVHFNSLLPFDLEHIDMISTSADACERVRIYPA